MGAQGIHMRREMVAVWIAAGRSPRLLSQTFFLYLGQPMNLVASWRAP